MRDHKKHPQTIGKLERTHASPKGNLKIASGEYRRQWHKYLPLAILNYNTTYHSSLGCEPSRIFHGRVPYNILDYRLGLNPNPKIIPATDFAEELQRRTQILIDKTKKHIMQSYLKYKKYYDRKAKAAPLEQGDFCFILQPLLTIRVPKSLFENSDGLDFMSSKRSSLMENILYASLIRTKRKFYTGYALEKTLLILLYKLFALKAFYKLMMKLLFHKMTCTLFHGKPILMISLLVLYSRSFLTIILLILMNKTI